MYIYPMGDVCGGDCYVVGKDFREWFGPPGGNLGAPNLGRQKCAAPDTALRETLAFAED